MILENIQNNISNIRKDEAQPNEKELHFPILNKISKKNKTLIDDSNENNNNNPPKKFFSKPLINFFYKMNSVKENKNNDKIFRKTHSNLIGNDEDSPDNTSKVRIKEFKSENSDYDSQNKAPAKKGILFILHNCFTKCNK